MSSDDPVVVVHSLEGGNSSFQYGEEQAYVRQRRGKHVHTVPEVEVPAAEVPAEPVQMGWWSKNKHKFRIGYWTESMKIAWHDRDELIQEHPRVFYGLVGVVGVFVLFVLWLFLGATTQLIVYDAVDEVNVAAFYDSPFAIGSNFSVPSRNISCDKLRYSPLFNASYVSNSTVKMTHFLETHPEYPCVCAPMFGLYERHIALRNDSHSLWHMYNPQLHILKPEKVVCVPENQLYLFPKHKDGTVYNLRYSLVEVVFYNADEECSVTRIGAESYAAYCVQMCYDLLSGVTVYDKARSSVSRQRCS